MATHFAKFKGLKLNMRHTNLTDKYINKMIVREHVGKIDKLHPDVKKRWNDMTKEPEPFKYPLQELPTPDYTLNKPLGLKQALPFQVERTLNNNLPVYTDFRNGGMRKLTVIRKIMGDVDEFKSELAKVVSNSPIEEKMGRIEVSGVHSEKVKLWLRRLGF